jgi:tetratricopeptide (TPR) repeat protein
MTHRTTMLTISKSSKAIFVSSLFLLASTLSVRASKLTAQPLPHAKDMTDSSQVQQIAPPNSRFHKSNDFRDLDKAKADQDSKAEKRAEIDQQKATNAQIKAEQARIQGSIEANNKAVQLGRQGRFIEAIQLHENAIQLDPNNKEFRINLSAARTAYGQQRLAQGDFASASHLFRQALSSASDNGLAGRLLVSTIAKSGLNPSSPDVRINLGDQLIKAGDLEGAAIEYQAALELADSAKAYTKMGDMALRYGQTATAVSWYRQAVAKDPDYAIAYRQLGFIALAQKDSTQAAAYLRKAVVLDGKDTLAGDALVDLWRRQVATSPTVADNHLGLAAALQITGDLNGAVDEYQKVQSIDPKNPHLAVGRASLNSAYQHLQSEKHKLAAQTFYSQNLRKEALAEISEAVMLEPRNAKYQQLLGECLEANGDYQGAHQAYLTCVLIDPENNKEAAARMKQMQTGLTASSNSLTPVNKSQDVGTPSTQNASNRLPPSNNTNQEQAFANDHGDVRSHENQPNTLTPAKDMFEGQSDSNILASSKTLLGVKTTDKNTEQNKNGTVNDLLMKTTQAESQQDYVGAADILRQILAIDLKNADLHHRLAVNLMSSGDIVEAISEFRIASALKPSTKAYSEDLAQALTIHKRAQVADSSVVSQVKQVSSKQGTGAEK